MRKTQNEGVKANHITIDNGSRGALPAFNPAKISRLLNPKIV